QQNQQLVQKALRDQEEASQLQAAQANAQVLELQQKVQVARQTLAEQAQLLQRTTAQEAEANGHAAHAEGRIRELEEQNQRQLQQASVELEALRAQVARSEARMRE